MPNFKMRPDNSGLILASLRRVVPEFFDTEEYLGLKKLGRDLAEIPGLICAAYARYICRILDGQTSHSNLVERCFNLIEEWASHSDQEIHNLIVTEIFENVRLPKSGERQFSDRLGASSRRLFEVWMK